VCYGGSEESQKLDTSKRRTGLFFSLLGDQGARNMILRDLKILILKNFDSQADFAGAARIDESRVSRIIRGRIEPNARELDAFRRLLGIEVDSILTPNSRVNDTQA